jgi:hypothetical protein
MHFLAPQIRDPVEHTLSPPDFYAKHAARGRIRVDYAILVPLAGARMPLDDADIQSYD